MGDRKNVVGRVLAVVLTFALVFSYAIFQNGDPAQAATTKYSGLTLAQVQQQILKETNAYRKSKGLKALTLNASMNTVAVNWSKTQAKNKKMAHNPNYGKQIPKGAFTWGENVAYGYAPTKVTTGWWNSAGHKANILNKNFTHIGIGVAADSSGLPYYTQVFGGYKTAPKTTTATKSTVKKYVTKTALNLRKSATTNSSRILTIPKGANVGAAKAKKGVWYQVTYKSKTGWVHSSYLK